ncbi:hypothetical protein HO173_008583 [Letharia columbiana]|uniref:Glycosyltransferase family 31 protein n=1 Tax=Letharia columbiana TaxID=112416 RepID=A0A8H6L2N8_9LECA|nr:uncharacterized protein HO173_008583 [Letharia columbiana]KAF6233292.1 hypothetical protein HO173_008583 [Letharia columbiana]
MISSRNRIVTLMLLSLAASTLLVHLYFRTSTAPPQDSVAPKGSKQQDPCRQRLGRLKDLNVKFPIKYARRDIKIKPRLGAQRPSVTNVDEPLFPKLQIVDPGKDPMLEHCMPPLSLEVSPFPKKESVDASHVLFGMSTLLSRLEDSIPFLERWLAHTGANLFVIVVNSEEDRKPDKKKMSKLQSHMRDLGIKTTLVGPLDEQDDMPLRYFSLVKLLYSKRDKGTQWIGIVDDDTFFPSMHSLINTLGNYDSRLQQYVGGISEEWWSVVLYGLMAFGGAGLFLSLPMAAMIDSEYQACREQSSSGAGDMRIQECIQWHSHVKLTPIPGLHQMDMGGDLSGVYESGWRPLSLHHWKADWWDDQRRENWVPLDVMHLVADVCGECFLQRWHFGEDTVLSNGYSIATYAKGITKEELQKPEHTWLGPRPVPDTFNPGYVHSIGTIREPLKLEEEKIQYMFLDAQVVDGGVRQYYLHKGLGDELDTLVELFWSGKAERV